jgi:hypothetical protein
MNAYFRQGMRLLALFAAMALTAAADAQTQVPPPKVGHSALNQDLDLTRAQKDALYDAVIKDKSKTSPVSFPAQIGSEVPPTIELYQLPDEAVPDNPAAKLYKYTLIKDQVIVVDPTKMRVVDVIHK